MKGAVQKAGFGEMADGSPADLYTLTNARGLVAKVTNYGTIITELHVPDRAGKLGDIVLGFDNLNQYLKGHPYFGCTVGRFANRIAKGQFTLEGKSYHLAINNGPNHLHGGLKGFDKVLWGATQLTGAAVEFTYTSADGEEGYPGKLKVVVVMTLTDSDELRIDYTATTDRPTPINLTNHSYFNLAGAGDILRHQLTVQAGQYTPVDSTLIPTGEIRPVGGTPLDFTKPQAVGARISQIGNEERGYDHNFVLDSGGRSLALAARVYEPDSGRVMEVSTTQPGIQLYTANYLDGTLVGKGGRAYSRHCALCLETQHFPDSVNQPKFPTTVLRPGETYRQTTVHRFLTQ